MQQHTAIIRNCLNLFQTQGLKITMDDIARELGMSKRTLYEIFESKTDLVFKSIEFLLFEDENKITQFLSSENINIIEELFPMLNYDVYNWIKERREFLSDIKRTFPDLFDKVIATHLDEYKKKMGKIIQKGVDQGFFRKEINVDIVKIFFFDLQTAGKHNKELFEGFPVEKIFENTILCFVRGMSTPKGIDLIEEILQRDYPYFSAENEEKRIKCR